MQDYVGGYPEPQILVKADIHVSAPLMNGKRYFNGALIRSFDSYPMLPQSAPASPYPLINGVSAQNSAVTVVSRSSPTQPLVDIPTAIGELKDLPGLVREWGSKRLISYGINPTKPLAQTHLTWRWAIRPMISDMQKLLKFMEAVDQRHRQLRYLQSGNTLHGSTVGLGSEHSSTSPVNVLVHSNGALIYAWRTATYESQTWGTAQWYIPPASGYLSGFNDQQLYREAQRLVLGLSPSAPIRTAWELLPWSWMADWFTKTGDSIAAVSNQIGMSYKRLCLMQKRTSRYDFRIRTDIGDTWVTFNGFPFYSLRVDKWRLPNVTPSSLGDPVQVPVIDGSKWSILLSLAALRAR